MAEFQLWDIEAGSYIGKYADERDALSTVKKLVDHFGPDYAQSLSLGRIADNGKVLDPLSGSELVARIADQYANPGQQRHPRASKPAVRKVSKTDSRAPKLTATKSGED